MCSKRNTVVFTGPRFYWTQTLAVLSQRADRTAFKISSLRPSHPPVSEQPIWFVNHHVLCIRPSRSTIALYVAKRLTATTIKSFRASANKCAPCVRLLCTYTSAEYTVVRVSVSVGSMPSTVCCAVTSALCCPFAAQFTCAPPPLSLATSCS